ncbi:MAG: ATP-grasp domain-containing protein [Fimbriimonadaceae bacterium]
MAASYDIGFLGGGQLARMSIQAAQRMGLRCLSLDPGADTPASQIADSDRGSLNDPEAIARILGRCRTATLENEFIPAEAVRQALAATPSPPVLVPLARVQDKYRQRQAYLAAGVPSPRAVPLDDGPDEAIAKIGFPMVLKARFGGYDGKGTRYVRNAAELDQHRDLWSGGGWMAEDLVPFRRELAVMVFVTQAGEVGAFPTMETVQTDHVCDLVFPSGVDASEVAVAAARAMGGPGLFGVELFELESGETLVNEIAPRPHNTGHYTLDWGAVSQFEQHVRLVLGLPVELRPSGADTAMANLLGQPNAGDYRAGIAAALEDPTVHVHWYGKAEPRPGRKLGHINATGPHAARRVSEARQRFYRAWTGSGTCASPTESRAFPRG